VKHFSTYAVAFVAGYSVVGLPFVLLVQPVPSWAGLVGFVGAMVGVLIERRRLQWRE
jgi:hypothetical protein